MNTDLKKQAKLPANRGANACYTPGPWRIVKNPNIGDAIESVPANITIVGMPLNDADGYLIAAAPDLYKQLKAAIEIIHIWHGEEAWGIYLDHSPEMKRIRAALEKAEKGV